MANNKIGILALALIIAGCLLFTAGFWKAHDHKWEGTCLSAEDIPHFLLFSPDGEWLVSQGRTGIIQLWERTNCDEPLTLETNLFAVQPAFSPDSRYFAYENPDDRVEVWDVAQRQVHSVIEESKDVCSIAFCPQQDLLAFACANGTVMLWDLKTRKSVKSIEESLWGDSLVVTPTGEEVIFLSGNGLLKRWYWRSDHLESIGEDSGVLTTPIKISPTGKHLAYGTSSAMKLWDLRNGTMRSIDIRPSAQGASLSFSPDGKVIGVSHSRSYLAFLEVRTGLSVGSLSGIRERYKGVCFHPDGKVLATGIYVSSIRVVSVSRIRPEW